MVSRCNSIASNNKSDSPGTAQILVPYYYPSSSQHAYPALETRKRKMSLSHSSIVPLPLRELRYWKARYVRYNNHMIHASIEKESKKKLSAFVSTELGPRTYTILSTLDTLSISSLCLGSDSGGIIIFIFEKKNRTGKPGSLSFSSFFVACVRKNPNHDRSPSSEKNPPPSVRPSPISLF